jgi:hypothetical protein
MRRFHSHPARQRRPRAKPAQLALWNRDDPEQQGRPDLQPTSVLLRHRSCARVLEMIRQVRLFFPELDGLSLRVGLTRSAAGLASREEPWIWVNPRKLTRHTIAHELTHLLQNQGLLPGGEKSADLHSLARHAYLADDLPYYLKLPRALRLVPVPERTELHGLLHQVARESLEQRAAGLRTYLKWFEEEMAQRWPALAATRAPAPSAAAQADLFAPLRATSS